MRKLGDYDLEDFADGHWEIEDDSDGENAEVVKLQAIDTNQGYQGQEDWSVDKVYEQINCNVINEGTEDQLVPVGSQDDEEPLAVAREALVREGVLHPHLRGEVNRVDKVLHKLEPVGHLVAQPAHDHAGSDAVVALSVRQSGQDGRHELTLSLCEDLQKFFFF